MTEFWLGVRWRVADFLFPERNPAPAWSLAARGILLGVVAAYSVQFRRGKENCAANAEA